MEYFGIIAFILVLSQMGSSSKINKLEKEIQILKRKVKGENTMSKLLNDLIGKKCIIDCEEIIMSVGKIDVECEVIDVDDEWVKVTFKDKKGVTKTNILRVENIKNIELI